MNLKEKWEQRKKYKDEFKTFLEKREAQTLEDILLSANLATDPLTKEQALSMPAFASALNIITNTIALIPICLYQETNGKKTLIKDDIRVSLLNRDTKDTLDSFQFKKALIEDYLVNGNGYAYINKQRNNFVSLNYVKQEDISINSNFDPIFKNYEILCNGNTYRPFEFLKILRKTKDGASGIGILEENNEALKVSYLRQQFESILLNTGGNKKGFITSENKLDQASIDLLKQSWKNLYSNNTENIVVLNKGISFKEASNTSVEMQLAENKKTDIQNIYSIFGIPANFPNVTEEEYNNFIKFPILPILKALETALNRDLLLESEKSTLFFSANVKEILKGDLLKRYQAYQIGINSGFLQWDEIRHDEDLEPYNVDFIKLGLQDVLYNPESKEIYTPNTNKLAKMGQTSDNLEDSQNINNNIVDNSNQNESVVNENESGIKE